MKFTDANEHWNPPHISFWMQARRTFFFVASLLKSRCSGLTWLDKLHSLVLKALEDKKADKGAQPQLDRTQEHRLSGGSPPQEIERCDELMQADFNVWFRSPKPQEAPGSQHRGQAGLLRLPEARLP